MALSNEDSLRRMPEENVEIVNRNCSWSKTNSKGKLCELASDSNLVFIMTVHIISFLDVNDG